MNRKTDNELLDDVLAEAAPGGFREALLEETLRVVRQRRRIRRTRNVAGVAAVLALLGMLVLHNVPRQRSITIEPTPKAVEKSYTLIQTQRLSAGSVITTRPLAPVTFETSTATVEIVETTPGNFRLIDDQQLLALVAAHPAVLVRTGPHSEQLVFANPDEAKGFPPN